MKVRGNQMLARIIQSGTQEHRHALEYFDLSPDIFQDVGEKIIGAYNQATPNDARNAAGKFQ